MKKGLISETAGLAAAVGALAVSVLLSGTSIWAVTGAARSGAAQFVRLIDELRGMLDEPVDRVYTRLIELSGYVQHLDAAGEEDLREPFARRAIELAHARGGALHPDGSC